MPKHRAIEQLLEETYRLGGSITNDEKKKYGFYLSPEVSKRIDASLAEDNCKNRSEFVEKALQFYMGYLGSSDSNLYMSRVLYSLINGMLTQNVDRLCSLLFKLAVEVAMMTQVIGANLNYNEEELRNLRGKCVKDVKTTFGKISLEEAARFQNGIR
ncbi:MAG: hypothetical protein RSD32_06530 [Oscillospiraceae bacterium]